MEIKSLATPVFMGIYPLLWRNMDFYETGIQITIPSFIYSHISFIFKGFKHFSVLIKGY